MPPPTTTTSARSGTTRASVLDAYAAPRAGMDIREVSNLDVQFLAGIAVVAADPQKSRELYVQALGLPLEAGAGGDYFHTDRIDGTRHFGVWPLSQAAHACFGSGEWPVDVTVPQASIEFEVADAGAVEDAAAELTGQGYRLLHGAREELWGQTVARLLSAEGLIIGISYIPQMHAAG